MTRTQPTHMAHNTYTWKLLEVSSLFFPFVAHVFPILEIIFIHMSFRLKENCTSCYCKLYLCLYLPNCSHLYLVTAFLINCNYFSYKLQLFFLQTNILQTVTTFLANCQLFLLQTVHLENCHLANCKFLFLQTVILQTVILLFHFQHWAVQYGLIACGEEVDLKSFSSVKAHFNGLSIDEVS